ncbi:flagellar assembly protein FliH [Rhodospirillum centenum]|uniref:Flagellar assembly protein FliH, putative n=1 Tax=Rhodospirillum centenum (strain ATCC 51521 / SW) TaxID=414684 RepID=B6IQ96_RHOCS|nr:flagellar assembly protein FliH [Rhodospirillum centenum]ACI97632.1 flagellar assembly protein FliH, putative [Rhodospirillum centenum SW]
MPRPFRFGTEFPPDLPPGSADVPPEPLRSTTTVGGFTEEDLESVRDRAFRQGLEVGERNGFERGQQSARQAAEAQMAEALAGIEAALRRADETVGPFREQIERDAVRVVSSLVTRLAPPLLDTVAEAELDTLVLDCLHAAVGTPRLELRLPPGSVERMREQVEKMQAAAGFRGTVALIPDPSLPPGAATADWGTGGAVRDPKVVERRLSDAVAIAISRLTLRGGPRA